MDVTQIKDDEFLKQLNKKQLNEVAKDIRSFIVDSVSKTGGHLSSNLGDVELIMAMHKVFDYKTDKFLFDVGHQAYTHKILTGRAAQFENLREIDGISGFIRKEECQYDVFESGHSSTSISTALGMAIARDANHENYEIVSLIGDGSIANGVAFEALNNIANNKHKIIVILNDNDMAINQSVGAIARGLSKIRTSTPYDFAKRGFIKVVGKIPLIGPGIIHFTSRCIHRLVLIFRSDNIFDNFDISYLGPIDGHDFKQLDKAFKKAKKFKSSILIHVKTKKGYGYSFTEKDTTGKFHGTDQFDKVTGQTIHQTKEGYIASSQAYANTIYSTLKENVDAYLISAAMINGSKLENCFQDFPLKCIDVGIAEEHAIALANGLSLNKKYPIVSMYSTFLQRGYDEIVHDVCRINSNILFYIDRAGIVGKDGATHQGMFDVSFLYPLENSIITMPSAYKYIEPTIKCLHSVNGPKFIRYQKSDLKIQESVLKVEFGKFIIDSYKNENPITFIGVGNSYEIIKERIIEENLPINCINPLFLKPLDNQTLDQVRKSTIILYDNTSVYDGFASHVVKYLSTSDIRVYTLPDQYIKHGSIQDVLKKLGLDEENMFHILKELSYEKKN